MQMLIPVTVHVQRFEVKDASSALIMTDVVACGEHRLVALPECTYCRAKSDDLNPFDFDRDAAEGVHSAPPPESSAPATAPKQRRR